MNLYHAAILLLTAAQVGSETASSGNLPAPETAELLTEGMKFPSGLIAVGICTLLLLLFWGIGRFYKANFNGRSDGENTANVELPAENTVLAADDAVMAEEQPDEDDGNLIAAISAAVAAYLAAEAGISDEGNTVKMAEAPINGFRVVSFKIIRK